MTGWLINDCLTCIPGTKTFWHDLLEWFPNLIDMTNGHTFFRDLANTIEHKAKIHGEPDYIIRNATFFRDLNLKCHMISFLQDYYSELHLREQQINTCNGSDIVVFNSPFTESVYGDKISLDIRTETIPIGTDFDLFHPMGNKDELRAKWHIPNNCILFIGSTNSIKGFNIIENLIKNTNYNFCLVMKDDFKTNRDNVKVFNRVNHQELVEIINCCTMLICTSVRETLHLSGIEAAACDIPVLATNVGIYHNRENGVWGRKATASTFEKDIQNMFKDIDTFSPRDYFLKEGLDRNSCREKWRKLL